MLPGLGNVLFLSFLGPNELSVIVSNELSKISLYALSEGYRVLR